MNYNDLTEDTLNGLTEEEKQAVFSILEELKTTGNSETFNTLKYADYSEIPVDIETFLHNKTYLGNALYDQEGRFTLFPYWEETLKDIFPDSVTTKYNTLIFTGAIGLGKSTIAVICLLYLLYRLLCLKDPYLYYGLQPIDKISISLMNITLENAKGVAMDKMNQMILSSSWFMSHGKMTGTSNLVYIPDKHIELITASSNNQVIGRAIFCLDGETEIATTSGFYKLKDLEDIPINVISVKSSGDTEVSAQCTVKQTAETNLEYEIELEDTTIIRCTPSHRLMLKDGSYKMACELTDADELFECKPFGYIYKFTNLITNKIYIGKREKSSFDNSYYGSGKTWKEDLVKYGKENIKREILCWGFSRADLNTLEIQMIELYDAKNPSIGYNIHKGGQSGNSVGDIVVWSEVHKGERNGRYHKVVSEETRLKLPKANIGRGKGIKNPKKGRPCIKKPDGFGEKVSKALTGKERPELGKKVICIETSIIYESAASASRILGIPRQNISRACLTGGHAGGYSWRYLNEN